MYAAFCSTSAVRPIEQVLFCRRRAGRRWRSVCGCGTGLISALVEGTYTAPTASAGFVLLCANLPRSLSFVNPMALGAGYLLPDQPALAMPWGQVAAYMSVAALMIVAAVKVIERRDF